MLFSVNFRQILTKPASTLLRSRIEAFVQTEFWCGKQCLMHNPTPFYHIYKREKKINAATVISCRKAASFYSGLSPIKKKKYFRCGDVL
jgi:hypothetical protein